MAIQREWWSFGWRGKREVQPSRVTEETPIKRAAVPQIDIAPNDPVLLYFQGTTGAVDIETLNMDSAGLRALRAAGVKLVLPLVSQGELIGLVNLGQRLSEQDYSSDDRRLLGDLATQAAPAVRVAQLAQQQQLEARERERLNQELKVARLIQQTLLPKEIPSMAGWQMATYYQPARAVGGDFYDFFKLSDGRLGVVIGDVTDKGVPAALVMATTRAILRGVSQRCHSPGTILERANDQLYPDIPAKMFVTCLCVILDPATGRLTYANAGHDLPYRRGASGVDELRATGMPLGLMPGMKYEERELLLGPGETVLLYSDGLVEAHNRQREMFSFGRLQENMRQHKGGTELIPYLLSELAAFTGEGWEQEDDVTLVVVQREEGDKNIVATGSEAVANQEGRSNEWQVLAEFSVASEPGNERKAIAEVVSILEASSVPWQLSAPRLNRLKTAVAEATMNAIEHGNANRPELSVDIQVMSSADAIIIRITDHGGAKPIAAGVKPDIEAKLAGLQSPRGWGLFLIENMVDEMHVMGDETHHTVELSVYREELEK